MKKFLVLYKSSMSAEEQMQNAKPEDGKKMMDLWMAWFQKAGSAIVDGGSPLGSDTHVDKSGNSLQHVGDYIGGYSIVQAESMDAVKAMLTNHPHFMQEGNNIEVLEMLPMPGM
jgi:hypothetical protein